MKGKKGKQKPTRPKPPAGKPKEETTPPCFDATEVFSLDVECVAVGRTHLKEDRTPCAVALVDGFGKTVMSTLIKPDRPVVSYLTPITGLHAADFEKGKAIGLTRAINELKAVLPKHSVLVGQQPQGDADWMQLAQGVDYRTVVDLGEVFRNERGWAFSLRHEALVLLGKEPKAGVHDPCWDAAVSIALYQKAIKASTKELQAMRDRLTHRDFWPAKPSMAKVCGFICDGVCLSAFNAQHCTCGKPIETKPS